MCRKAASWSAYLRVWNWQLQPLLLLLTLPLLPVSSLELQQWLNSTVDLSDNVFRIPYVASNGSYYEELETVRDLIEDLKASGNLTKLLNELYKEVCSIYFVPD